MTRLERAAQRKANRRSYVRRITHAWGNASPQDIADGHAWYAKAHQLALEISPDDVARGAGIIAALSPRISWSRNKVAAQIIADRYRDGQEMPYVTGVLQANARKAWRIASGESPDVVLGGQKVKAFYANIIGDHDAVTVDTWAAKVATDDDTRLYPHIYDDIASSYRHVARKVGVSPAILQASTWVAIRGRAA